MGPKIEHLWNRVCSIAARRNLQTRKDESEASRVKLEGEQLMVSFTTTARLCLLQLRSMLACPGTDRGVFFVKA